MKTLYVDLDEEISDLLGKISALKGEQILLVIPKDALIFQNAINFKLLKQKMTEDQKEIQVFTNDESGKKMLEKVGIRLYQGHLRKRGASPAARLSQLPLKEVKKQDQKKISITEISDQARKKNIPLSSPQRKQVKRERREWTKIFLFNTLRKKTVMAFTAVAVLFFGVVFYIAVPSATIYITPAANVLETTTNIIFADPQQQPNLFRDPSNHVISLIPIDLTFEKTILYKPTGKIFTGSSARCNLKVSNQRTTAWTLVPDTRFQDSTGVIFRTDKTVEVPPARFQVVKDADGNPSNEKVAGTIIVSVEADQFDENGNVIGARGNFAAGTPFTLPGLSKFNQGLLSAVNETPCRGGVTDFYSVVTEDDLVAAEEKIKDEMEKTARQYLVDYVSGENVKRTEQEGTDAFVTALNLFDHPQGIQYEVLKTSLPLDVKEGQKINEFSVAGSMKVKGIAYERQRYYEILEQSLLAKVHPSKVLQRIDYDTNTFTVVYSDSDLQNLSKVKISVTVRGLEEYNFDPKSAKGKELVERILNYVPGKTAAETSYFISNLEEIQKANISIWPFWRNSLPERKSSITIRVQ